MPKEPVLFSRCESDLSFTQPVKGNAFSKVGTPIYDTGYFGNAMKCDAASERWTFNPNDYFSDIHYGTMEMWFEHNNAISNPSNFIWIYRNVNNYPLFGIYNVTNNNTLRFAISKRPATTYLIYDKDISGLANGWHHAAISWSADSIDSKKQWVFFDGSEEASANVAMSGMIIPDGAYGSIGDNPEFPGANYTKELIDNFKIYDYAKTDFSDRFDERGGMNDEVGA